MSSNRFLLHAFVVSGLLLAVSVYGIGQGHSKKRAAKPTYKTVKPLIASKCQICHNDNNHPESVNLSSYAKLMKSGQKGPIVVAGHPEKSKLLMYVDGTKQPRMPFKLPPLGKKEIASIRDWIKAGAKP